MTPEEGIRSKKIKYMEEINGAFYLKKNDNYYYQVQGQLNITGRMFCYFVVWTPLGLIVDKIQKDIAFWKKAEAKLSKFYIKHMLRHILKST